MDPGHNRSLLTTSGVHVCVCVCISIILRSARWPEESAIYYSAYGMSSTQLKVIQDFAVRRTFVQTRKISGKIRNQGGRSTAVLRVGRKPVYQPKKRETDRLTGPADGNSRVDSRMRGHSRRFIRRVVLGERSRLEELQRVFNVFLLDEPSQASLRHPDPREGQC